MATGTDKKTMTKEQKDRQKGRTAANKLKAARRRTLGLKSAKTTARRNTHKFTLLRIEAGSMKHHSSGKEGEGKQPIKVTTVAPTWVPVSPSGKIVIPKVLPRSKQQAYRFLRDANIPAWQIDKEMIPSARITLQAAREAAKVATNASINEALFVN